MGARLDPWVPGHDVDVFDDYCEHLLVRDEQGGAVIGTYRVLTPAQALRAGSTYADTEFDLTRLRHLRGPVVELGRSCVHPAHRHGGVILALWGALAEFMVRNHDRLREHSHVFYRNPGNWRHAHGTWHLFVLCGTVSHYLCLAELIL